MLLLEDFVEGQGLGIRFPETERHASIHTESLIFARSGELQFIVRDLLLLENLLGAKLEVIQNIHREAVHKRAYDIWHMLVKNINADMGICRQHAHIQALQQRLAAKLTKADNAHVNIPLAFVFGRVGPVAFLPTRIIRVHIKRMLKEHLAYCHLVDIHNTHIRLFRFHRVIILTDDFGHTAVVAADINLLLSADFPSPASILLVVRLTAILVGQQQLQELNIFQRTLVAQQKSLKLG